MNESAELARTEKCERRIKKGVSEMFLCIIENEPKKTYFRTAL